MITLQLPFPPSVNKYWRNVNGRTLLSIKGRRYKNAVIAAVYEQLKKKPDPILGKVAVNIEFYPPDNVRRDMDNFFKALFDSLTVAGIWIDDSQIKRIDSVWFDDVKSDKVNVKINPFKCQN